MLVAAVLWVILGTWTPAFGDPRPISESMEFAALLFVPMLAFALVVRRYWPRQLDLLRRAEVAQERTVALAGQGESTEVAVSEIVSVAEGSREALAIARHLVRKKAVGVERARASGLLSRALEQASR
jgi:hypothetical protein